MPAMGAVALVMLVPKLAILSPVLCMFAPSLMSESPAVMKLCDMPPAWRAASALRFCRAFSAFSIALPS